VSALGEAREALKLLLNIGADRGAIRTRVCAKLQVIQHALPRQHAAALRHLRDSYSYNFIGPQPGDIAPAIRDCAIGRAD
jgi:hypothetical protein